MNVARQLRATLFAFAASLAALGSAQAIVLDLSIDGSDAIFLAGRSDLVIPPASDPWPGGLGRHAFPTPEEILETLPPVVPVVGGDVVRLVDPAVGGISFFLGFGGLTFGPEGRGDPFVSSLTAFGGISGYLGPEGALVGVFLNDDVPASGPPPTRDFTGANQNFTSITPLLGQIFYIGNGQTSGGIMQEFVAPTGATRLFLGIPDGFGFDGPPGAYDDNDGGYRVRIGINEVPSVPEPGSLALLGLGLAGLYLRRRKR